MTDARYYDQDVSTESRIERPFVELLRATYARGVVELKTTDQEDDILCLALSNALDELASLIAIYNVLKEGWL